MTTRRKAATKSPAKRPAAKSTKAASAKTVSPAKKEAAAAESPRALRSDGPTLKEWTDQGHAAEEYPPEGYAARVDEAEAFQRPAEPATVTNVPVGRFPAEDSPEPGSGFAPAPSRFPEN